MRIGIDGRLYRLGTAGIGRYTQELVKNLLEIDRENQYVLFLTSADYLECRLSYPNLQKVLAPFPHYSLAEQTKFWRFLYKQNLDLMHFTNFNHPILYRKPYVITIHDLTLMFFPGRLHKSQIKKFAYQQILRDAISHAKKIIAVSEHSRQDIIRYLKAEPEKVIRIYEGVAFSKAKADERIFKKCNITQPYVLYVGRWNSHKNILAAIGAISLLNKEFSKKENTKGVQLVLAGKRDEAFPEIPQMIEKLNLQEKVIITDFVSDEELTALYQKASCFLFLSLYEGFGLPALEAQSFGVPVIAARRSSLPEILENSAILVEPTNLEDIAGAIKKVLQNQALRKSLKRLGLRNVSRFSFHQMAEETLKVYKEAVGKH